ARAAQRPKATLSRRVAQLEAALGLRLFERGAHTLKLTEEGRALHERTGALLHELTSTAEAIASGGEKPRGRLRVSAPLLFSQTAMGKVAAGFALQHPDVRLEVTTEDRPVDPVEEGYDLVIRVNPPPDESLVGRIVLRDRSTAAVSLVSRDLASGRLAHWGDVDGPEIVLWALYPSRRLLSARVSAFLDYLKRAFPAGTAGELAAYLEP
ncbi:MAG: LysR family transcriptional regulator, partial [Myxococcales bacterium]